MKDSYQEIFSQVNRVLVVFAHPDDCEVTSGSTIARLIQDNKKVRLVVATNGGKGVRDKSGVTEEEMAQIRIQEQIDAGIELGIPKEENFNLNMPDGQVELTFENIGKIVWHIRDFKPDLIITHNPSDIVIEFSQTSHWVNHRDHRNTGLLTIDATYPYSRDNNFFPEQLQQGLTRHEVHKLLTSDSYSKQNTISFATSDFLDYKRRALAKHTSQFSPDSIEDMISEMKQENGYFELLGYTEIY